MTNQANIMRKVEEEKKQQFKPIPGLPPRSNKLPSVQQKMYGKEVGAKFGTFL